MNDRPVLASLVLGALLVACGPLACVPGLLPTQPNPAESGPEKLQRFKSSDDLVKYWRTEATRSLRGGFFRGFAETLAGGPQAAPAANDAATGGEAGAGGPAFSGTNLQEADVDESDVLKTDGAHCYIARGSTIRIVRVADPGDMTEVGRVELERPVHEMYLRGDRLLVLSQQAAPYCPVGAAVPLADAVLWPPYYPSAMLTLYEVSVADPANPVVGATVELDGTLVSSRLTHGRLILVLAIRPELPSDLQELAALTIEQVLPDMRVDGETRDLVPWTEWLHPTRPGGYETTAVVTLNADDLSETVASAAVMAGASTIYASGESLYVTDAAYDAQGDVRQTTAIHKFTFDENGAPLYTASGTVPGRLLNQFSLGEHAGYLRVATHVWPNAAAFGEPAGVVFDRGDSAASPGGAAQDIEPAAVPSNAVFVLGEEQGALTVVGEITGIAPNEQLFAARFLGDRGFLVTFRVIDPLFALDLSDPANPVVRGELKIPGVSDYLHPWGERYLIGVGRTFDGGANVQLSLFDVGDLDQPQVVEQITIGAGSWSWSEVSQTHKAFAFLPDQDLLAIPVHAQGLGSPFGGEFGSPFESQRVVAYRVSGGGLEPIGSLAPPAGPPGFWLRPMFIGDRLFAITTRGLSAAPLDALGSAERVELAD